MSAGAFVKSKYIVDYGDGSNVHPIRVQPETVSLAIGTNGNDPPAGAITNPISAVVSRGKRARGLRPRLIALRTPPTGQPANYLPNSITLVPALNKVIYAAAESATDETEVSYNGVSGYKVAYVIKEEAR